MTIYEDFIKGGKRVIYGTDSERLSGDYDTANIEFHASDTDKVFLYDGDSWVEQISGGGSATGTLASTTVAVAGLTTIGAAIDVSNYNRIMVRIDNSDDTGAAAIVFDAFQIQASVDDGSNFEILYSNTSDYTVPTGILIGSSGDLTVLPADATGWFILDCGGLDQIRVQASANTTESVGVTGTWSAN